MSKVQRFLLLTAATIAALLVPAIVYLSVIRSTQESILNHQENLVAEMDKSVEQGRSALRKLPQFREEFSRLSAELEKLRKTLPENDGLARLYLNSEITPLLRKCHCKITRYQWRFQPTGKNLSAHPNDLQVEGDRSSILEVLQGVENGSPAAVVSYAVMETTAPGKARLSFVVTLYSLPDR
jgi:hypothetical protein